MIKFKYERNRSHHFLLLLIKFNYWNNGSHLCFTFGNQRHGKVGIYDFYKFRCSKLNLDSAQLLLIKFNYGIGSCLWFKKVKQRFDLVFPYLNFIKEIWKEMWSVFSILKLYQQEWKRVRINFSIFKFQKVSLCFRVIIPQKIKWRKYTFASIVVIKHLPLPTLFSI